LWLVAAVVVFVTPQQVVEVVVVLVAIAQAQLNLLPLALRIQ
jgi:hypothetical protein